MTYDVYINIKVPVKADNEEKAKAIALFHITDELELHPQPCTISVVLNESIDDAWEY